MLDIVARAKAIVLTPQSEWPAIEREPSDASALLTRYVAILALIPALARLIGGWLIGGYTPILSGLIGAVAGYVLTFVLVYAVALLADALAPSFGSRKDFSQALKLTVYSFTPLWLAGIFLLVPGLSFLSILGLYGLYLMWIGLPVLMRTPSERALPFAAAIVACAIVLEVLARVIVSVLFNAAR